MAKVLTRLAAGAALAGALTVGSLGGTAFASPQPAPTAAAPAAAFPPIVDNAVDVADADYAALLQKSRSVPVVLEMSSQGCQPCEQLAPVLTGKAKNDAGKWLLARVDVGKDPVIRQAYGSPWTPTLIALKDGKEVGRHTGYNNNSYGVENWIDTFVQGKPLPPDPTTKSIGPDFDFGDLLATSQGRVVVTYFGRNLPDPESKVLEKISAEGKGKFLVALADEAKVPDVVRDQGMAGKRGVIAYYHGVPVNQTSVKDEASLRAWITTVTTTHYPDHPEGTRNEVYLSDEKELDEVLAYSQNTPVVMEIGTRWCYYCNLLSPIASRAAAKADGSWLLVHVDADELPGIADKYHVRGYPTTVVISKGAEIKRFDGLAWKTANELLTEVNQLIGVPVQQTANGSSGAVTQSRRNSTGTVVQSADDSSGNVTQLARDSKGVVTQSADKTTGEVRQDASGSSGRVVQQADGAGGQVIQQAKNAKGPVHQD
ncbi:thioredoxin [Amycolatopsis sp. AA4]|uniref:thioredoxin domain-containing protein n=1 Tax=Actinomycetes TaxID=1760 RepID=UPI0001DEEB12|nr:MULTISPECIES: thioredoxin family protein [Actinomycetes]ATY14439.1 thioredoxin [Amycolatopsis sp. AA4]EFL10527.1 predicted protein [Streptomyces sp. AA4]